MVLFKDVVKDEIHGKVFRSERFPLMIGIWDEWRKKKSSICPSTLKNGVQPVETELHQMMFT